MSALGAGMKIVGVAHSFLPRSSVTHRVRVISALEPTARRPLRGLTPMPSRSSTPKAGAPLRRAPLRQRVPSPAAWCHAGGASRLGAAIAALLVQDGAIDRLPLGRQRARLPAARPGRYGGLVHLVEGDVSLLGAKRYIEDALAVKGDSPRCRRAHGRPGARQGRRAGRDWRSTASSRRTSGARRCLARAVGRAAARHARVDRAGLEHAGRLPVRGSLAYACRRPALVHAAHTSEG
jgi:hypothetical protein